MSQSDPLGQPRPLTPVMGLSVVTLLAYYSYYKWIVQEELRAYEGQGWSGNLCLLPFLLGVTLPPLLSYFDPDVPPSFAWLFLLGVIWIYIVQFRLYCKVNQLYREEGLPEPLVVWWVFIPGLNLVVGLRQIHFLSEYWARRRDLEQTDPVAAALPLLFSNPGIL